MAAKKRKKRPFKATGKFTIPDPDDDVFIITGYGGGGSGPSESDGGGSTKLSIKRSDVDGKPISIGKSKT